MLVDRPCKPCNSLLEDLITRKKVDIRQRSDQVRWSHILKPSREDPLSPLEELLHQYRIALGLKPSASRRSLRQADHDEVRVAQAGLDGHRNRFTDEDLFLIEPGMVSSKTQGVCDPTNNCFIGAGMREEDPSHATRVSEMVLLAAVNGHP